jgi:hypothetical protein
MKMYAGFISGPTSGWTKMKLSPRRAKLNRRAA